MENKSLINRNVSIEYYENHRLSKKTVIILDKFIGSLEVKGYSENKYEHEHRKEVSFISVHKYLVQEHTSKLIFSITPDQIKEIFPI